MTLLRSILGLGLGYISIGKVGRTNVLDAMFRVGYEDLRHYGTTPTMKLRGGEISSVWGTGYGRLEAQKVVEGTRQFVYAALCVWYTREGRAVASADHTGVHGVQIYTRHTARSSLLDIYTPQIGRQPWPVDVQYARSCHDLNRTGVTVEGVV